MGVWFREPMIVGKSGTVFWGIDDDHISLIRFSRQSRQWRQLVFQFWHRNHWHSRPDWVALSSDQMALESGTITTELTWHDWRHWRQFGEKNRLVGEFKFFSEFSSWEISATDWKQTKAANRSHQQKLFQTNSSRFPSHFKKLKKTTRVP